MLDESNPKPNKIWVNKGSEFYNSSMKSWLQNNMYSTHSEENSVVTATFITILKNKSYKYMTPISESLHIDKLDDIVNKYINYISTYHGAFKTNPAEVKPREYIEFGIKNNDKNPKFKVGDHVRILKKYKDTFAKGYVPTLSEEIFVIRKVKNTVPWMYAIEDLNGKESFGTFHERELKKTN